MAELDGLYLTVFWWTLGVLGAVWLALAGALLALRAQGRSEIVDEPVGRSRFDVAWTVAPALVVVLVAIPTFRAAAGEDSGPESAPAVEATVPEPLPEMFEIETADPDADADEALAEALADARARTAHDCCESGRRTQTKDDDLVN